MSRTIPAALVAAFSQESIEPYYAIEMSFSSGTVRLWTGYGDRTIDGQTYTGAGTLLAISGLEETGDLSAKGATVSLSGIAQEIVSVALQEPYQGREARILCGETSVSDFVEAFAGLMDTMPISTTGDTATVSLTIESKQVTLQKPNVRRYTSANHKLRHPTDTFCDFVAMLQDKELAWGRKT